MTIEGYAPFEDSQTWYRIDGEWPLPAGAPAPLVVLHGGPGATHDYLLPLTGLAHGGRAVVMYDQLGNGSSTHHRDRGGDLWTVELFVRELANLLRHLGIEERYHVLGQSWGGFLAQEYALTQPRGLLSGRHETAGTAPSELHSGRALQAHPASNEVLAAGYTYVIGCRNSERRIDRILDGSYRFRVNGPGGCINSWRYGVGCARVCIHLHVGRRGAMFIKRVEYDDIAICRYGFWGHIAGFTSECFTADSLRALRCTIPQVHLPFIGYISRVAQVSAVSRHGGEAGIRY